MNFQPKNKKNDQLKILSETEIQSKLYGKYRKPHLEEHEGPSSFRKSQVQPVIDDEGISQGELFQAPAEKREFPVEKTEKRAPENSKIESYLHRENRIVSKEMTQAKPAITVPAGVKNAVSAGNQKLLSGLKAAGIVILSALAASLNVGVKLSAVLFDLKKPASRKVLIAAGSVLFLVLSLAAINWLNVKRDNAMKSPRKISKAVTALQLGSQSDPIQVTAGVIPSDETKPSAGKSIKSRTESPVAEQINEDKAVPANSAVSIAKPPAIAAVSKPYAIQVATYINNADAQKMADDLTQDGFPSFVEGLSRQSGRVYHCVFIGRFKTFSDAERQLNDFKKRPIAKPFQDAFIRSLSQS